MSVFKDSFRRWNPLLITVMVLFSNHDANASSYSEQVIADGAIHYWRFEESATTDPAASEVSAIAGTYEGGVSVGNPSAGIGLGHSAKFDGTSGSHISLGSGQHSGNSISVEAWVNLDVDATSSFSPVVARWDGSYELDVNATDNGGLGVDRVDFVLRNDSNTFGDPASPTALIRGAWHHVVGVFDSATGNGTVYLDGVAGAPFALGGALQDAGGDDGNFYIGTTRGPASNFNWKGLIDEVAIYDFPLSQDQIDNHIRLADIPEPSSVCLLVLGSCFLLRGRRKR